MKDRLFGLALEYKKKKLWKKLWDSELFAVTLPSGELGYCCVMGHGGDYVALAVYVGQTGMNSYWDIRAARWAENPAQMRESFFSQSCLHCGFENKDELNEEELAAARDYARRKGFTFRGQRAFPQFTCYQPYCFPYLVQKPEDEAVLCQALSAAIDVANHLEGKQKTDLGFAPLRENGSNRIPLLTGTEDGFVWSITELPGHGPVSYPKPELMDEMLLSRMKRYRKKGDLQCELVRLPEPVAEGEGEPPRFPIVLFALNREEEYIFPFAPVTGYEENPQPVLDAFCRELERQKSLPQTLYVRDERTECLFRGLCKKLSIQLVRQRLLPDLDAVEDDFFNHFDGMGDEEVPVEMLEELFAMLDEMDEEELKELPPPLMGELSRMLEDGLLPTPLGEKVSRALGLTREKPQEKDGIILFPGWNGDI